MRRSGPIGAPGQVSAEADESRTSVISTVLHLRVPSAFHERADSSATAQLCLVIQGLADCGVPPPVWRPAPRCDAGMIEPSPLVDHDLTVARVHVTLHAGLDGARTPGSLIRREREVAVRAVQRLTNRGIAERYMISGQRPKPRPGELGRGGKSRVPTERAHRPPRSTVRAQVNRTGKPTMTNSTTPRAPRSCARPATRSPVTTSPPASTGGTGKLSVSSCRPTSSLAARCGRRSRTCSRMTTRSSPTTVSAER